MWYSLAMILVPSHYKVIEILPHPTFKAVCHVGWFDSKKAIHNCHLGHSQLLNLANILHWCGSEKTLKQIDKQMSENSNRFSVWTECSHEQKWRERLGVSWSDYEVCSSTCRSTRCYTLRFTISMIPTRSTRKGQPRRKTYLLHSLKIVLTEHIGKRSRGEVEATSKHKVDVAAIYMCMPNQKISATPSVKSMLHLF